MPIVPGTEQPSGGDAAGGVDAACDCPCHRGARLVHAVPCCRPCAHCGRRVPTGSLAAHLAHAHPIAAPQT
jgi:hypothetical protein